MLLATGHRNVWGERDSCGLGGASSRELGPPNSQGDPLPWDPRGQSVCTLSLHSCVVWWVSLPTPLLKMVLERLARPPRSQGEWRTLGLSSPAVCSSHCPRLLWELRRVVWPGRAPGDTDHRWGGSQFQDKLSPGLQLSRHLDQSRLSLAILHRDGVSTGDTVCRSPVIGVRPAVCAPLRVSPLVPLETPLSQ